MEGMRTDKEKLYRQIGEFAKTSGAAKVVLFGSRARGDNREKSDIDIAVYGCPEFLQFVEKIEEELWSLLKVDIINMDEPGISDELLREIKKDGVVLYEEIR